MFGVTCWGARPASFMSPSSSRSLLHIFGRRRGDSNGMGCAQGKPASRGSPARSDGPRGLDRLMRDNAYRPASGTASRLSDPLPVTDQRTTPADAAVKEHAHARRATAASGTTGTTAKTTPDDGDDAAQPAGARAPTTTPPLPPRREDGLVDGWPTWLLDNVPREALHGIVPKSADAYDKIEKVGQGTYSNVYKARERGTGRIVALKKVRFDTSESESVRFMAREMRILQRLDHPNVIRLEGIATSRMHRSIYLVFDFMYSDLARIVARGADQQRLTEPQIKCYMQQLLSGLQHCHERGILHRDIKGSNLLIDRHGVLKIGDFGLANYYGRRPLTSRVVTLWYRAPELLLGSTDYGVGIDLWSAGCLLAEMFFGKPLMPGRTEIEQLYRIFSLCGSPPDDYWRKQKVSATYRPTKVYKSTMAERLRDLPPLARRLITTLLALDPAARGTAAQALRSDFFSTPPLPCDLSSLPVVYKEEEEEEVADPSTSHDGRKPKLRQRSHRRKDSRPKAEEQLQADEPKNNSESPDKEENRVTDAAKSGQESDGVQESPGNAIVDASSSTVPKQFLVSPVQVLPQPKESKSLPASSPQDQLPLPTASRHDHSGSDEDHEDRQLLLPPDHDQADDDGEPSFIVLDRSLENDPASMTDYDAAVATLRGSGELTSNKQHVLMDHV